MTNTNLFSKIQIFISKLLLFTSPLIITTIFFIDPGKTQVTNNSSMLAISGLILFLLWFILLICFVFSLLFSKSTRTWILTKLTCSSENDERELQISGKASKATFLSTISFLLVLFILSFISIIHSPGEKGMRGFIIKKISQTTSLKSTELATEKGKAKAQIYSGTKNYDEFSVLSLSKSNLILLILLFHIASYHINRRRY